MTIHPHLFSRLLAASIFFVGGLAGWFGHLGYERATANRPKPVPTIMVRGVEFTPVMRNEVWIFRTAFHDEMDLNNPALRKENDDFADQCLAKAIDNYKANPSAPFSAFLIQQIDEVNALAGGGSPSPEMVDAVAQLRAFRRAGN